MSVVARFFFSNFYPRPPRGGRPVGAAVVAKIIQISIHALREEGDNGRRGQPGDIGISIHALREEGDGCTGVSMQRSSISIHALREEGDIVSARATAAALSFLSTPSARRATHQCTPANTRRLISIHALREEGDRHLEV